MLMFLCQIKTSVQDASFNVLWISGLQKCSMQELDSAPRSMCVLLALKEADAFDMSLWKLQAIDSREWTNTVQQSKTLGLGTLMNAPVGSHQQTQMKICWCSHSVAALDLVLLICKCWLWNCALTHSCCSIWQHASRWDGHAAHCESLACFKLSALQWFAWVVSSSGINWTMFHC